MTVGVYSGLTGMKFGKIENIEFIHKPSFINTEPNF